MNRLRLLTEWAFDQLYGTWISFFPPKGSDGTEEKKTPAEHRTEPPRR